jgi:hypothetical protein
MVLTDAHLACALEYRVTHMLGHEQRGAERNLQAYFIDL